jgi:hypothetical protein
VHAQKFLCLPHKSIFKIFSLVLHLFNLRIQECMHASDIRSSQSAYSSVWSAVVKCINIPRVCTDRYSLLSYAVGVFKIGEPENICRAVIMYIARCQMYVLLRLQWNEYYDRGADLLGELVKKILQIRQRCITVVGQSVFMLLLSLIILLTSRSKADTPF